MTTTVKIFAHCANTKEVQVHVSGALHATLQDGESIDVYAYDERVVSVKEVVKGAVEPILNPVHDMGSTE